MKDLTGYQWISSKDGQAPLVVSEFVEQAWGKKKRLSSHDHYRLYVITSGSAKLVTARSESKLEQGDVVMIRPDQLYCMRSKTPFMCKYIAFFGERAAQIVSRVTFTPNGIFRCHGRRDVLELWIAAHTKCRNGDVRLIAEGTLLYTLGILAERRPAKSGTRPEHCVRCVLHYLEEHFHDPALSLHALCEALGYNDKYVSSIFHRVTGKTFSAYLCQMRLAHALRMFEDGYTSVKDVAMRSGIADSLYFSRLCRKYFGMSPTELIASVGRKNGPLA